MGPLSPLVRTAPSGVSKGSRNALAWEMRKTLIPEVRHHLENLPTGVMEGSV